MNRDDLDSDIHLSPNKRIKYSEAPSEGNMVKQNKENPATISSLDQLPVEILETIMVYVPQSDLPSCCLASKSLYSFATKKLYSKIEFLENDTIYKWEESSFPIETTNYATKLLLKNRWKFLATVMSNKHIASLIKSFSVQQFKQEDGFPEISHYISILLCHVDLDDFFCMNSALVPTKNFKSIQNMACLLTPYNGFYENLSELKIFFDAEDLMDFSFDDLAHKVINQNMHHKLRSLAILFRNSFDSEEVFDNSTPIWSDFFNVFVERGVKLTLTALSLSGEFWDMYEEDFCSEIICEAVEVSKVETLDIEFANYLIPGLSDDVDEEEAVEDSYGVLSALTKKMPSLSNLCITHDVLCTEAKLARFIRVLKEDIPNQLKSLRINFMDQPNSDVQLLQSAILSHQQNLVQLNISCDLDQNSPILGSSSALQDLEEQVLLHTYFKKFGSSKILESIWRRPILEDRYMDVFESSMKEIKDYLHRDLIYAKAARYLPHLREYVVLGIYIDMKSRRILNNGLMISLEQ